MQRTKTKQETAKQAYCNVTDIQRLLTCSWKKAKKVYQIADEMDAKELGRYRIEDHKVRITSVCKASGISLAAMQKLAEA